MTVEGGGSTLVHCLAHVRRKFVEAEAYFPDESRGNRSLSGAAKAARGQRGSLARARPATALILMGDWCAPFETRHPKPDDAGAQPPEPQRPGPLQRAQKRGA